MTDKEATEQLKNILKNTENILKPLDEETPKEVEAFQKMQLKNYNAIETVLNLIQTQQEEIEHQKEKRENQKKELAILNEKQKEFNKLVNTVKSYKGQFKRQQAEIEKYKTLYAQSTAERVVTSLKDSAKSKEDLKMLDAGWKIEIEKKDRQIDLIVKELYKKSHISTKCYMQKSIEECLKHKNCIECLKQYFERKAENGN